MSKIALSLLFHLVGDYLLQNSWIANNKTKKTWIALLHAGLYTALFYFITGFTLALFVIFSTHFLIDRFRLAVYWIKLVNWSWGKTNFGYGEKTPPFLSTWLMIIIDNTFHIIINTISILFLIF